MRGVKALFTRPRRRVCSAPSVPSMLGGGSASSPSSSRIWRGVGNEFEKPASSRSVACTSSWRKIETTRIGSPTCS